MFERIKTNKLLYKADNLPKCATGKYTLPCLTSSFNNQGLNYYVPRNGATILKDVISIPSNSDVYRAYFQSREFTVLSDAYAIRWKSDEFMPSPNQYLFMVMCINKVTDLPIYSYKNKLGGWNVVKDKYIQLPKSDGKINFVFMENFIAELEAQHVAELEAYFSVTGLNDTQLSIEEEQVLTDFDKIKWEEYKIVDIFVIKNTHNILSQDVKYNSGTVPYLGAGTKDNSVISFVSYKESCKEKGQCIFIAGKTFVVTYQKEDFYSNDSHNLVLYVKDDRLKRKFSQLALATCIYKSLNNKYSWGNSISFHKIQSDMVFLPVKNGEIDFDFMRTIISAVHKLVIKEVFLNADRKSKATRKGVSNNK